MVTAPKLSPAPEDSPLSDGAPAPRHAVAVIGGATAGAELAERLAEAGAVVVVFEQNPRPYGKIEDGLPRWHVGLRRKEYDTIVGKLSHPGVAFVPRTRIGEHVPFAELVRDWGFSAVVLANGAWRDRPLPVPGADAFVGRGLVYQNQFIIWFNHANEKDYRGPVFTPEDGVLVVGGGLASIDVVKVLMLETTRAALAARGIEAGMLELEVKGIPKILATHGLSFEELGLEGCTLFYRRRLEDMPLVEVPEGATPEREAKVQAGRRRLLEKAQEKYRFRVEPLCVPDGLLVEGDRLVGLRLRRTQMQGGRPVPTDETFERRGPTVISSIGSVPEPMEGIEMAGELYAYDDWDYGRFDALPDVFACGNVVTGKGNIVASRKHATHVAEHIAGSFLGLGDDSHEAEAGLTLAGTEAAGETAARVGNALERREPLSAEAWQSIRARVLARQHAVGYDGDLGVWLERVTPPDLE